MYPHLSLEDVKRWQEHMMDGGYYVSFILVFQSRRIGVISFDTYEVPWEGKGRFAVLDTWHCLIVDECQGGGRGKFLLLKGLPKAVGYYWKKLGLRVTQIMIETNTESEFYRKVLPEAGFQFQETETELPVEGGGTAKIYRFLVDTMVYKE